MLISNKIEFRNYFVFEEIIKLMILHIEQKLLKDIY
jgi:hypothetical protein